MTGGSFKSNVQRCSVKTSFFFFFYSSFDAHVVIFAALQGGREVSDFVSYLKREASNPLVMQEEPKKKKQRDDEL